MSKVSRHARKSGQAPGTLMHLGKQKVSSVRISVIDYSRSSMEERVVKDVRECFAFKNRSTVTWINVSGLHNPKVIEALGECYGIHSLIMEDILNTEQRPKMEDLDHYLYLVLKMLTYDAKKHDVEAEQVSMVVGRNFVITFHEHEGDVFDNIRDRIRNSKGKIRHHGAGYLAYSLLDAIVDHYFGILEQMGEQIEKVEDELVSNPTPKTLRVLNNLKREIIYLRRAAWPLREVINGLERSESHLIREVEGVYLRDVYDHTAQIMDTIETYRDILSSMLDIYLSSLSNRMNEVMKVLTIIATIFIPLTFITGVYGMNFKFMPELGSKYGYAITWGVMILMAIGMLIYFRRKKWV